MSFPPCVSLSRPVSGTGARRAAAASTLPRALLAAAADAPTAYGVPPCPCAVQLLTACA